MFDVIINKIKECAGTEVGDRLHTAIRDSVVVRLQPCTYDGCVCHSKLQVVCVAKTYDSALVRFDAICDGIDTLPDEEGEVLEVTLSQTVIKYDTVSGMMRIIGTFDCYTEVRDGGID